MPTEKTRPLVKCGHCDGTGEVPMPLALLRVLEAVREGNTTANKVYQHLQGGEDVKQTAINNRLEYLRQMGFLSMQRQGRFNVYAVVEQKGE